MKQILCNYYISYRCNAQCIFCDIWKPGNKTTIGDARFEDVSRNLRQLKSVGVKFIDFTGGEPLLHALLPDMLNAAKELGFFTSVTTNCLLYPKRAHELKGLIDLLHFSLDSLNEKEHNQLRGKKSFDSVMHSIRIAQQIGERPDLLFTVTESNYRAAKKLVRFAGENKLMLIINPVFSYSGQQALSKKVLDFLAQFVTNPNVYINRALHRLIRSGGNQTKNPRCRAVSSTVVISPDNRLLLPCYHFRQTKIPIKDNLEQILHAKVVKFFERQQGRFEFCRGCTINCYFDPSFLYKIDDYFWLSLLSKLKYGVHKFIR